MIYLQQNSLHTVSMKILLSLFIPIQNVPQRIGSNKQCLQQQSIFTCTSCDERSNRRIGAQYFYFQGKTIKSEASVKLPGINIDHRQNSDLHISELCKRHQNPWLTINLFYQGFLKDPSCPSFFNYIHYLLHFAKEAISCQLRR